MTLTTSRTINKAIQDNALAGQGAGYVFARTREEEKIRIIAARSRKGVQQVQTLNGQWLPAERVWQE